MLFPVPYSGGTLLPGRTECSLESQFSVWEGVREGPIVPGHSAGGSEGQEACQPPCSAQKVDFELGIDNIFTPSKKNFF